MGKYIVELKKNETLYKAATRESDGTAYVCSAIGTPYTAPDIEQEKDRQARIEYNFDEIKDVLETTVKECNVSLDEIAEVLRKMKETDNG